MGCGVIVRVIRYATVIKESEMDSRKIEELQSKAIMGASQVKADINVFITKELS